MRFLNAARKWWLGATSYQPRQEGIAVRRETIIPGFRAAQIPARGLGATSRHPTGPEAYSWRCAGRKVLMASRPPPGPLATTRRPLRPRTTWLQIPEPAGSLYRRPRVCADCPPAGTRWRNPKPHAGSTWSGAWAGSRPPCARTCRGPCGRDGGPTAAGCWVPGAWACWRAWRTGPRDHAPRRTLLVVSTALVVLGSLAIRMQARDPLWRYRALGLPRLRVVATRGPAVFAQLQGAIVPATAVAAAQRGASALTLLDVLELVATLMAGLAPQLAGVPAARAGSTGRSCAKSCASARCGSLMMSGTTHRSR